jgi:ADP-ribose pyrophosphatase YjhB (NUDIX family)
MTKTVTCVDIDGKPHEISTEELRWRPSAYGIVIKDNELLVSPQFNGYDLPGGGLDLGELPEDAVAREVKEETGIIVTHPRLVTARSNFFKFPDSEKGDYVQSILLYYICDFAGGELSDTGFDEYERIHSRFPEWLPLDRLDSISLGSSHDWRPYVKQAFR